jgi:putative transposase
MASGRDPAKALKPGRLRDLVRGMCSEWAVSIRRACGALCFDRSTLDYQSRRADQAPVKRRIKEICESRVRYGYRRVHVLLRREGWEINMKKTWRIYDELGLKLRNKHPKRRVKAKLREDRQEAAGPNEVWAMDFMHDQLATGRKLRILTVVDTHSRYCPAADPRFADRGEDVVQTLERVCRQIGYPQTIQVDNGSEFTSRDLDLWAYANDATLDFSRPGKLTDNGFIEAFNSKLRSECLNTRRHCRLDQWRSNGDFLNLADARESWRLGAETTTTSDHTAPSATRFRARCTKPVAQPARHRETAGKIQLPAVQSRGSEQVRISVVFSSIEI